MSTMRGAKDVEGTTKYYERIRRILDEYREAKAMLNIVRQRPTDGEVCSTAGGPAVRGHRAKR